MLFKQAFILFSASYLLSGSSFGTTYEQTSPLLASLDSLIEFVSNEYESKQTKSNLENTFSEYHLVNVDVRSNCEFMDYLSPNEQQPINIVPELQKISQRGILVSTGTERSIFDLLLGEQFEGLVVRDINPRVKAYVDFNVALLRISHDLSEYKRFSSSIDYLSEIMYLISESQMDEQVKKYYLKHLESFAPYFYRNNYFRKGVVETKYVRGRYIDEPCFEGVQYYNDEKLFLKIQKFARDGNIISTIGDIGDLRFLGKGKSKIVAIDTSNIGTYILLDFKLPEDNEPLIIWTSGSYETKYYSYKFEQIEDADREEFNQLYKKLTTGGPSHTTGPNKLLMKIKSLYNRSECSTHTSSYSNFTLNLMREYGQ